MKILMLLVAAAVAGLLKEDAPPSKPRLTAEEVIQIANAAAQKAGLDLSDYDLPRVKFVAREKEWSLVYRGKADKDGMVVIGRHFSVSIEDGTKKVSISRGR